MEPVHLSVEFLEILLGGTRRRQCLCTVVPVRLRFSALFLHSRSLLAFVAKTTSWGIVVAPANPGGCYEDYMLSTWTFGDA